MDARGEGAPLLHEANGSSDATSTPTSPASRSKRSGGPATSPARSEDRGRRRGPPAPIMIRTRSNVEVGAKHQEPKDKAAASPAHLACGILYANAMGLCGIVLVALGSTLSTIAGRCGTTATDVGTVFLARGAGAVVGGLVSMELFSASAPLARQRRVVVAAQIFLAAILGLLPGCKSVAVLHVLWGATGLGTATLDTGVQIATRDAHGVDAPPWHVYNTVAFAVAGAIVPLTLLATHKLIYLYGLVASLALLNAAATWSAPRLPGEKDSKGTPNSVSASSLPEYAPRIHQDTSDAPPRALARVPSAQLLSRTCGPPASRPFRRRGIYARNSRSLASAASTPLAREDLTVRQEWGAPEVLFGTVCFWLLGGKVDATSYVTSYIIESGIVPVADAPYAVLTLWLSLIAGRLVGLKGQMVLIDMRSATGAKRVARHLALWLCLGTLGVLFIVTSHDSRINFWFGLAVYGFGNGPSIGYCYDLVNRISNSTVEGLVVIMMGLNLGSSIVPYTTALVWDWGGPGTLIWAMLICITVPLPLLYATPFVLEHRERQDAAAALKARARSRPPSDADLTGIDDDDAEDDTPVYI